MVFPQLRVYDVKGFVPPFEALFDERAKHPMLLVEAVEESANMAVLAETATGTANGVAVRSHVSPPAAIGICQSERVQRANHPPQRACSGTHARRERAPERCRQDTR
jgi:hypothetical protein